MNRVDRFRFPRGFLNTKPEPRAMVLRACPRLQSFVLGALYVHIPGRGRASRAPCRAGEAVEAARRPQRRGGLAERDDEPLQGHPAAGRRHLRLGHEGRESAIWRNCKCERQAGGKSGLSSARREAAGPEAAGFRK
eukprot:scaffold870_cov268-Pinguiococcus_pyrenoidosus.AAC.63